MKTLALIASYSLLLLQSCNSGKDDACKRIEVINIELNYITDYKSRYLNLYDATHEKRDTIEIYKVRDSLYILKSNLEKEKDSLWKICNPNSKL